MEIKFSNFLKEEFNTVIIGSGASALNCALHLFNEGIPENQIAIVTEQLGGGTSFNAGSDKQTYYKLSLIGEQEDSPMKMAQDYFRGGAMHGDIALIEATNSVREFFHLVELGVPFPYDKYGGYVGYKTDNDPKQRATSIGPLTSQKMSECLLKAVQETKIEIFDHHYAIDILVDKKEGDGKSVGLIALNIDNLSYEKDIDNLIDSLIIFHTKNVVIATGGPALLYKNSAYPKSQWGGMGLPIRAGCIFQNLTESQFGIASIKFRWNLSGSYQQVIPRYYSLDENGNEEEFLNKHFPKFKLLSKAIFLKGYQWPFSVDHLRSYGSSLIDLAVYYETEILKNQVFLDYTRNPSNYNLSDLDPIAREYLINSNAMEKLPIDRLKKLNPESVNLFLNHNIDLSEETIQISVCNQHLNGGISGNIWWESNIKHLFAIGEVNGSHGIHRPGGAALNSGQVGGLRSAIKIARNYNGISSISDEQFFQILKSRIDPLIEDLKRLFVNGKEIFRPNDFLKKIQESMAKFGSIIRPMEELVEEIKQIISEQDNLNSLIKLQSNRDILQYLRIRDALITQQFILESILNYHERSGKSRGSYLIIRDSLNPSIKERYVYLPGDLEKFKFITSNINLAAKIQKIKSEGGILYFIWENIREIPTEFGWFENTWKKYNEGLIFKKDD